jgi:hypothetical protein
MSMVHAVAGKADEAAGALLGALGFREVDAAACPQAHPAAGERVFTLPPASASPD